MKKVIWFLILLLVFATLSAASIISLNMTEEIDEPIDVSQLLEETGLNEMIPSQEVEIAESPQINELPLVDNEELYQYDDPTSVVVMYVTVRKGTSSDKTDHTWEEVNDTTKFLFNTPEVIEVPRAEIILQIGDENGLIPGEVGFGDVLPNGTIQVRGNSSSMMPQKSYKIVLRDNTGGWRGQYTIPINKHIFDAVRVKNKLCFDLVKEVPHLISYRTQFVQLYVKDETSDPPSKEFVDYGLFTHIEQPNRDFLRNHQLDPNAHLYKAEYFEFFRYPEEIRMADHPLYDLKVFETKLEVKGNEDHSKLIRLLEDVNDFAIPIEESFEKYFDLDNYFSWMAFNILIGNVDTTSQNFFLYSPQNSERWYFILWDYDSALNRQASAIYSKNPHQYWEKGIQTYSGVILHRRVLMVEKYRKMLDDRISEILAILTPEKIKSILSAYREVTEPFLLRMPDYLSYDEEKFEFEYNVIPSEIENNYQLYKRSLQEPLPFFLGTPEKVGGELKFNWDESYDFDGENITYLVQVSRDYNFEDIIVEKAVINFTGTTVEDNLSQGAYFWRVVATDESGLVQYPFDYYRDPDNYLHTGMRQFYITLEGNVVQR